MAGEGRRGGVADKVLRGSTLPVLAVGPMAAVPPARGPVPIRRILVPLDGSSEAEQALPLALDLARSLHSEVHLVRVVIPATGNYGIAAAEQLDREMNRERQKTAKSYLESVREMHKDRVISTQVLPGFPVSTLRQFIDESDIDLVVMTSHSRYGAGLWTLGRVADSLLGGRVPVLLVKPA
jgi:nucleotide-binding universal stress UspA family protein